MALDTEIRRLKASIDDLRANRNKLSKEIGQLMGQKKIAEAEAAKQTVSDQAAQLVAEEALLLARPRKSCKRSCSSCRR